MFYFYYVYWDFENKSDIHPVRARASLRGSYL